MIVAGECQVSALSPIVSGVLTFDTTLHLLDGGTIRATPGVAPPPLTINITSGDLVMDGGSAITGGDGRAVVAIRETASPSPSRS